MDDYLHFQSGSYGMLMRAGSIREVLHPDTVEPSAAHALWRGRPVPLTSARRLLALPVAHEPVLIVHGGDDPQGLLVDRVIGLRGIPADDLKTLPPYLPPQVCRMFESACSQSEGPFLLRCRDDWTHLDEEIAE